MLLIKEADRTLLQSTHGNTVLLTILERFAKLYLSVDCYDI